MVTYLSLGGRKGDVISREWATVEAFLIELRELKENGFVNFLSRVLLQSHVDRPYPHVLKAIEDSGFDVNKSEETKRLYKIFQSYNSLGNRIKRTLKKTFIRENDLDWIAGVSKDYWDYYDAVVFKKTLFDAEFKKFINQALKSVQPTNASDWEEDDEMSDLEYLNYRIRRHGQAFIGKYRDEKGRNVLVFGQDPDYELYPQVKDAKTINYEDIKKGLFESNDFSWIQDIEPPVFKQLDIATKDDNDINVKWGDNGDFSEVIDSSGHRYFNQRELGLFLGLSYRNWSETINNLGKSNLLLYIKHLIDSIEWSLPREQEDYDDFIKLYKIVEKL